jgi:hypothetical protein
MAFPPSERTRSRARDGQHDKPAGPACLLAAMLAPIWEKTMIYIPPPKRPSIWPFIIEAAAFLAFQASIVALAILARAIIGG